MTHAATPYTPTFSPKVRTVVYVLALVLSLLTGLVVTLLITFDVLALAKGGVIVGAVGLACGGLAGGFGVAYRPTRADISDSGIPLS